MQTRPWSPAGRATPGSRSRITTYSPDPLAVLPGTTVCWTNNDSVTHNVTSVVPGAFAVRPGSGRAQSYREVFPAEGTFGYTCTLHPFMVAQLVVSSTAPPPPPPGPPPPPPPPPPPGSPPPPPASATLALAVTRFVVSARRSNGARWVVAHVTVNKAAKARLSLVRRGKTVSTTARSLRRGQKRRSPPGGGAAPRPARRPPQRWRDTPYKVLISLS